MKEKISFVIPCYNSEKMIAEVIRRIEQTINQREKCYEYEIILINDCSKDKTWEVISALAESNEKIKAINFSKNFGQHHAMMAGYKYADGDYIIGLDDDGENKPEDMFLLLDKLFEGYDCVFAEYQLHESPIRGIGTLVNNLMAEYLIDKPKDITLSSYYVVRRFVIKQIIEYDKAYPYIAGLILQATKNIAVVPLERDFRLQGSSGYTLKKLISLWVNGFTAFSVKPLRIATCAGMLFSCVGFLWGAILVVQKLIGYELEAGYTSIVACLVFFFGVIMIMLGIIGEYIGRIYISINNAPQYVIKEIKQHEGNNKDE